MVNVRALVFVVAASLALLFTAASFAGVAVSPGETVALTGDDSITPAGAVVAQTTELFTIDYHDSTGGIGEFVNFSGKVEGALTSTVVRETGTNKLAFIYDIDLDDHEGAAARAASAFTVNDFNTFISNVDGLLDHETAIVASRSSDGGSIQLASDDPGLGGAPRLVVRTDATDFASTGSAKFFAGDEFAVATPDGTQTQLAAGSVIIPGIFRPVEESSVTPIPLPPAGWIALGTLPLLALRARRPRVCARARAGVPSAGG
jgi:hypothetical protein